MQSNAIRSPTRSACYVARTYAYVAAGNEGLVIVDVEKPGGACACYQRFTADGTLNDARDVIVATTNASLFAYVADGKNGLKVLQLTSPESQPKFYGFSPEPKPQLIASYATGKAGAARCRAASSATARRRDRRPDRGLRPPRLAPVQPAGDAQAVPRRERQTLVRDGPGQME